MKTHVVRVIGVLSSRGRSLGLDLEDMVLVPVASAMSLFDAASLFRIVVEARSQADIPSAKKCILETIRRRHDGEDDITVITQDAVLATFNRILQSLTFAVGGIAAVSLAIAGVLIMNVLLISVSERTTEIGLLKALGSPRRLIVALFIAEALCLSIGGGLLGIAVGYLGTISIGSLYPVFPITAPAWAILSALGLALGAGVVFGAMPAGRAADLDPVTALSTR